MSKDKYIGLKLDFTDIYPVLNIPNPEDYKPYGIVIVKAEDSPFAFSEGIEGYLVALLDKTGDDESQLVVKGLRYVPTWHLESVIQKANTRKELITKKLEEVLTSLDELFTLTETTLAENDRIKQNG